MKPATTWQASLPAAVAVVPSSSSAGCRGELRVVRVAARAHKMGRGHALRRAQRIAKASAISQRLGKAQATDVVSALTHNIGALLDTSKYKKVSCSEPLGVTILLPRYQS